MSGWIECEEVNSGIPVDSGPVGFIWTDLVTYVLLTRGSYCPVVRPRLLVSGNGAPRYGPPLAHKSGEQNEIISWTRKQGHRLGNETELLQNEVCRLTRPMVV